MKIKAFPGCLPQTSNFRVSGLVFNYQFGESHTFVVILQTSLKSNVFDVKITCFLNNTMLSIFFLLHYLPGMQDWIVEWTNVKAQLSYYKSVCVKSTLFVVSFKYLFVKDDCQIRCQNGQNNLTKTDHSRDVDVLHFTQS